MSERLELWKNGEIETLVKESEVIQSRMNKSRKRAPENLERVFAKLMFEGKVNAALRLISEEGSSGLLELNDTTMQLLREKHPTAASVSDDALIFGPAPAEPPASYFDTIDEDQVLKAAQRTKGAGGPSQFDAEQYRHMLVSSKFKLENKCLREQIALLARKIASEYVDPRSLEAFVACRLIPLDKAPGIRPIGIGEILRRIVGKVIMWTLKDDIQSAAGPLQAGSGLEGAAEAAIHTMRGVFADPEVEAAILVDATNAFNCLNRKVALYNMRHVCPAMAKVLINTYREPSRLVIAGGEEIRSEEGTTQGDNLAGAFYALGTVPLQSQLREAVPEVKQVWLADDATGAGTVDKLRHWWEMILSEGRKYGYHVNASKSWLILKDPSKLDYVNTLFSDTGIKVTTEGKRHLGAALGSDSFVKSYAEDKVSEWCNEIRSLTKIATSQPQAAYAAFCHGERHRLTYFMRTIPGMAEPLKKLDKVILEEFLPCVLGKQTISESERNLYSLPLRHGGLAVPIFSDEATREFDTSVHVTGPLVTIMALQGNDLPDRNEVSRMKAALIIAKIVTVAEKVALFDLSLPPATVRHRKSASEKGASSWLGVLPLKEQGFTLTKGEFRDAIALRYGDPIPNLPSKCPCGEAFNTSHALNCKRGGFVIMRHNNVRDFEANLLRKVCNDVETEPRLQPLEGEVVRGLDGDESRPDVRARGIWRPAQNGFFDIRVTNVNTDCQIDLPTKVIYERHESEKKRQYNDRIMNVEHGTFTPLVFSVTGGAGPEAHVLHKHIADKIASKTGERYGKVVAWIRCKLSFLILRACLTCLRGSRSHPVRQNENSVPDDIALACDEANLRC